MSRFSAKHFAFVCAAIAVVIAILAELIGGIGGVTGVTNLFQFVGSMWVGVIFILAVFAVIFSDELDFIDGFFADILTIFIGIVMFLNVLMALLG